MSSTLKSHFKDKVGHLNRHEQITLHIKYKETRAFLSNTPQSSFTPCTKAVIQRVYCHSPVTICTITHIIFSLALRTLLADWLCAWQCRLPGGCASCQDQIFATLGSI
jgi:hypothetical protein